MRKALLLCLLMSTPALADDYCTLHRVASLDMTVDSKNRIMVPMTIGGRKLAMQVDTGGSVSMLDTNIATEQKMEVDPVGNGTYFEMFGGRTFTNYAIAHDVALGTMKADKFRFIVQPHSFDEDGMLAPDVLRSFDVEFDFGNSKMNLYSPHRCPGKVDYWADPSALAEIPIDLDRDGHIRLKVQVDGKDFDAVLDTGFSNTVASLETMQRILDIDDKNPDLKVVTETTVDKNGDTAQVPRNAPLDYTYPFKALSFGGVTVSHPDIVLIPDKVSQISHTVILGMNILRHLHLYIAYKEKVLYVTSASLHAPADKGVAAAP